MPDKRTVQRVCEQCSTSFLATTSEVRRGAAKFCSQGCYHSSRGGKGLPYPSQAYAKRFWARVDKSSECWEWLGARSGGYGSVFTPGRNRHAHCVAWELFYGAPIPSGMLACHHCDNPGCVRPEHLFLGYDADNAADKQLKGRAQGAPGSKNPNAKLTDEKVRQIRKRLANGETCAALAREYGVSDVSLSFIKLHRTWRHI